MMGMQSRDSALKPNDCDIQLLDHIRSTIISRLEADREYARSLLTITNRALKFDPPAKTPLYEVWVSMLKKVEAISKVLQTHADTVLATTVEALTSLRADRSAARQMFQEEKNKFDQDLAKAKAEIDSTHSDYSKTMVKLKTKQLEYNEVSSKGKPSKIDEIKRKYTILAAKLHRVHNDYILSTRAGKSIGDGLTVHILPMFTSAQQDYAKDALTQSKNILDEYVQQLSKATSEALSLYSDMATIVSKLDPAAESSQIVDMPKSKLEQAEYDTKLNEGYSGVLKADKLVVDNTTYDVLTQIRSNYSKRMSDEEPIIASYTEQISAVVKELSALDITKPEFVPKKRNHKYLERRLKENQLITRRLQELLNEVDEALSAVDPNCLPSHPELTENGVSQQQPNGISPTTSTIASKLGKLKEMFNRQGPTEQSVTPSKRPTSLRDDYCVVTPGLGAVRMTCNPEQPLENELWFHGILPREEVQRLLKNDGDYLVRESKKRNTDESQYVLSVEWNGPKHFIIQVSESGWRLEGLSYPTIQELIINQHNLNTPVTAKSQAILKTPIMRESWQLKNDDIILEEKIGQGNFGDVYRGKYKGEVVAVKRCKEELQEEQKKKFIVEGRILREYDHPNIVKFVGIAAQKNPVMIVMEYVSGGSLLNWLRKNGLAEQKRSLVQMCIDAAMGMEYLESRKVIHRDLAARNCLISDTKKVKISDFGMSREEIEYEVTSSSSMRQIPIKWTAPEALNYGKYTSLCDVWSFGILMWEVFSGGKTPYTNLKNQEARERVDQGYRMPAPEDCPTAIYSLMRDCWEEKPERRPHFKKITTELHDIIKGYR